MKYFDFFINFILIIILIPLVILECIIRSTIICIKGIFFTLNEMFNSLKEKFKTEYCD